MDNPGDWTSFSFIPLFKNIINLQQYSSRYLPDGFTPVVYGEDSNKNVCRREFFYNGWKTTTNHIADTYLKIDTATEPTNDTKKNSPCALL